MPTPGDLLLGQRLWPAGAHGRKRPFGGADVMQALFPLGLQGARDEPVLGLAGVELAAGAVGVDLRALELELGRAHARLVV